MEPHPYLDSHSPLDAKDAAVALLLLPGDKYLLQLRDPLPHIFYPGHWGCFGGAVDGGETPEEAVIRELDEELELKVTASDLEYFTEFSFDFGFAGRGKLFRRFYVLRLERMDNLTLREGAEMGAFTAREALGTLPLVSYDSFAIWMHASRERLTLR